MIKSDWIAVHRRGDLTLIRKSAIIEILQVRDDERDYGCWITLGSVNCVEAIDESFEEVTSKMFE